MLKQLISGLTSNCFFARSRSRVCVCVLAELCCALITSISILNTIFFFNFLFVGRSARLSRSGYTHTHTHTHHISRASVSIFSIFQIFFSSSFSLILELGARLADASVSARVCLQHFCMFTGEIQIHSGLLHIFFCVEMVSVVLPTILLIRSDHEYDAMHKV